MPEHRRQLLSHRAQWRILIVIGDPTILHSGFHQQTLMTYVQTPCQFQRVTAFYQLAYQHYFSTL
jgi:hypothetical protein